MIEARPRNFFSRHFSLVAAGQPIAELDASRFKEAAALTFEGEPYRFFREGLFSGDFVLEKDGRPLLRATKLSAFRSQFDFELDGRLYSLKRASLLRQDLSRSSSRTAWWGASPGRACSRGTPSSTCRPPGRCRRKRSSSGWSC